MIKILVTGANGQLGSELKELAQLSNEYQWTWVDLPELDLTDRSAVNNYFQQHSFDYIINCAAYTAVDKAESEKDLARKVNVEAVQNLCEVSKIQNACILHISTDFVFTGDLARPLTEEDNPVPLSVYGQTKLEGEEALEKSGASYFIFRTSWLYSSHGANFAKTMLRLGTERDELGVVADQIGTPTYAGDLANTLLVTIQNHQSGAVSANTLYHYSNEGVASWYDFAHAIFEIAGIKVRLKPIATSQYPTPAKRPAFSVLDKIRIKEDLKLGIPHWRESLKHCLSLLVSPSK